MADWKLIFGLAPGELGIPEGGKLIKAESDLLAGTSCPLPVLLGNTDWEPAPNTGWGGGGWSQNKHLKNWENQTG